MQIAENVTEVCFKKINIKEKYLERQNKFELLCAEVICCSRQIKIWLAISEAKQKFKTLSYESFWG